MIESCVGGPPTWESERCALLVAHPGHELRVLGWLEETKPLTCILTDGSGRSASSRLDASADIVSRFGGRYGKPFGEISDRELYAKVLDIDRDYFIALAEQLAGQLIDHEITFVAGDASEGSFMTHEIWRGCIDAAVSIAEKETGCAIRNFDFVIEDKPDTCPPELRPHAIRMTLDDRALSEKLEVALAYDQIAREVAEALQKDGSESFRTELLRPVVSSVDERWCGRKTAWEIHGEKLVAAGEYDTVVRFEEHLLPLLQSLNRHVARGRASSRRSA